MINFLLIILRALAKRFLLSLLKQFSFLQWKVRRTLAFSIHELAVILGDQLTAADLVPIFNGFLKDLDEVRIGVLKHLHDFLKVTGKLFCLELYCKSQILFAVTKVRVRMFRCE